MIFYNIIGIIYAFALAFVYMLYNYGMVYCNTKIIGYAPPYNIPIYDNSSCFSDNKIIHKGSKGTEYEGIYYGIKYECVEFVRRWYIHTYNITFNNVKNAYDIYNLKYGIHIPTNKKIPFIHFRNSINSMNSTNSINSKPRFGDIIIWKKHGKYINTGHVAIVIKVIKKNSDHNSDHKSNHKSDHNLTHNTNTIILVAEQNGESKNGFQYINISNINNNRNILGWMRCRNYTFI